MKLYNTPDKQIEEIEPQRAPQVTVYTCGPTVYDYPHIGNWFTFIRYDLLIRALKASGYRPEWALNITDVGHLVSDADEGEDKLEKGARREGKTARQIADFYTDYFLKGLERLNFSKPDYLPRATDYIPQQIELIKKLEDKGYTYRIDDGVYYDTAKFPQYADFAHLNLQEQESGARVEANPQKRNPSDFALWKFSPSDHKRDMEWDSPWGKGFPGWHLECSAMIHELFGDTVDIHAGGIDHIPVHHTNEIAQSQVVTGQPLAKYWMHANHILIDEEKISKSLGNGITLEDIEAKGFDLQTLRLLVLQSHYRSQSVFSWENLQAAQNRLSKWRSAVDLLWQEDKAIDSGIRGDLFEESVIKATQNDLDTPRALVLVDEAFDKILNLHICKPCIEDIVRLIDKLLGINLLSGKSDISTDQKNLIEQREAARQNQDWQKADELREHLSKQGIEINDTQHGPIWYRN